MNLVLDQRRSKPETWLAAQDSVWEWRKEFSETSPTSGCPLGSTQHGTHWKISVENRSLNKGLVNFQ